MAFRAPASSANLGPGFDALAIAVGLYVEVEAVPAGALALTATGEGAELASDPSDHLAVRVIREVAGHDRFAVRVDSQIPVGRGLGSSAALAVAAAAAAGSDDPLGVAARVDGHPENAAASVLGGLVAACMVDGRPVARKLSLDPGLSFVVVVPDRPLPTAEARAALPRTVPLADAAANLGRMGLMIAGMADRSQLIAEAASDRLHQGSRTPLFPESVELLSALVEAGALASAWSGAGPSMIGMCDAGRSAAVAAALSRTMGELGLAGRVLVLEADTCGLTQLQR